MLNRRRMERAASTEKAELLFYKVIEKKGKKMMKPLDMKTKTTLAVVRAVWDNTIIDRFYEQLVTDLRARGIAEGTTVQLRVRFSKSHQEINAAYKGTQILCEVKV